MEPHLTAMWCQLPNGSTCLTQVNTPALTPARQASTINGLAAYFSGLLQDRPSPTNTLLGFDGARLSFA